MALALEIFDALFARLDAILLIALVLSETLGLTKHGGFIKAAIDTYRKLKK